MCAGSKRSRHARGSVEGARFTGHRRAFRSDSDRFHEISARTQLIPLGGNYPWQVRVSFCVASPCCHTIPPMLSPKMRGDVEQHFYRHESEVSHRWISRADMSMVTQHRRGRSVLSARAATRLLVVYPIRALYSERLPVECVLIRWRASAPGSTLAANRQVDCSGRRRQNDVDSHSDHARMLESTG
jgi:hypothetical protein